MDSKTPPSVTLGLTTVINEKRLIPLVTWDKIMSNVVDILEYS